MSEFIEYSVNGLSCLVWKQDIVRPCNAPTLLKGTNIGTIGATGYWQFGFKGKIYATHRVVWTLLNGKIPDGLIINHINCERSDNRIENLELVTPQQNSRRAKMHINKEVSALNTSGINGVYEEKTWNGTRTKINYYARSYWHNAKGIAQRKSFAYSLYGKDKAWELAQEFVKIARNLVDQEVNERDNHGKQ